MALGDAIKADLRRYGIAIGIEVGARAIDWLGDVTLPRAPIRHERRARRRRNRDWRRLHQLYDRGKIAASRYQDLVEAWNRSEEGRETVRRWLDGSVPEKALDGLLGAILSRG